MTAIIFSFVLVHSAKTDDTFEGTSCNKKTPKVQ